MQKLLLLSLTACLLSCSKPTSRQQANIIPHPQSMVKGKGSLPVADTTGNIQVVIDTTLTNPESYTLEVSDQGIQITAGSKGAIGYAFTTLEQLEDDAESLPHIRIEDAPKYAWRGFMLDVSRHFFPKKDIYHILDILAYHKINKFHLHLTDGIGWRMEIKAYPELTRKGAWRKIKDESVPYVNYEISTEGADSTYGGYYTQQDLKEIVAYAGKLNIEVIPEIEMPGHSLTALACYPELLCTHVQSSEVYCAGTPKTFTFLQTILDEVMEVFPSEYLHIGGDEVNSSQWEACDRCKKIATTGNEVQKYFVQKMEQYVTQKGRRMLGWDEVTRDGLSSSAMIMSWTGWEGGIDGAKAGHDVIMCPLHFVYFDHYQQQSIHEPQAWGGLNTLSKVWSFPVTPPELDKSLHHRVKGGQANLWTESIQTMEHLEYMMLPRLAALSESLWTGRELMDSLGWKEFEGRIDAQLNRYENKNWNFSASAFTPQAQQTGDTIKLTNEITHHPIYFTLDGSEPSIRSDKYLSPIVLKEPSTLRAVTIRNGNIAGNELRIDHLRHKATRASIEYQNEPNSQYNGGGSGALTDNLFAIQRGDHRAWVGFEKKNMEFTVKMNQLEEISTVNMRFFQHASTTSVLLPKSIQIYASTDGKDYTQIFTSKIEPSQELNAFILPFEARFKSVKAQFIRVVAENEGILPKWNPRAGNSAWIFTDEVAID